jgi:hypothetical protein
MNCDELQLYLLATPSGDDSSARQHLAGCEGCRRFCADLLRLERSIEAAALSIEAPEGLSARVLLNDHKPRSHEGRDEGDDSLTWGREKLI